MQIDLPADASPEEVAAMIAALETLWPRPVAIVQPVPARSRAWQLSGRWWHRDRMAHTDRPWR